MTTKIFLTTFSSKLSKNSCYLNQDAELQIIECEKCFIACYFCNDSSIFLRFFFQRSASEFIFAKMSDVRFMKRSVKLNIRHLINQKTRDFQKN